MMFILRVPSSEPPLPALRVKATRKTPEIVANAAGKTDHFCTGEAGDIAALRAACCEVVELRDGWYADDSGGGVAIFGQGEYWEVRDTPFSVCEASGSAAPAATDGIDAAPVNVRGAVFGV